MDEISLVESLENEMKNWSTLAEYFQDKNQQTAANVAIRISWLLGYLNGQNYDAAKRIVSAIEDCFCSPSDLIKEERQKSRGVTKGPKGPQY